MSIICECVYCFWTMQEWALQLNKWIVFSFRFFTLEFYFVHHGELFLPTWDPVLSSFFPILSYKVWLTVYKSSCARTFTKLLAEVVGCKDELRRTCRQWMHSRLRMPQWFHRSHSIWTVCAKGSEKGEWGVQRHRHTWLRREDKTWLLS